MTWALSKEVWEGPAPCDPRTDLVCKDGFVIPCETKYGSEACWEYFSCVKNENFDCAPPGNPEVPSVPLGPSGVYLGAVLLTIFLFRMVKR